MSSESISPKRRSKSLSIAIPASLAEETPHLRDKTLRIGSIGRAAAIFRVEEIIIYRDMPHRDQKRHRDAIADILSYLETPQYLRRRLISKKPSLRYAGVLPPLRTPHHPVKDKVIDLNIGDYREGIVLSAKKGKTLVDVGVRKPIHLPNIELPVGIRVTIKITGLGERLWGRMTNKEEIEIYWGYEVRNSGETLRNLLMRERDRLIIATSRWGQSISKVSRKLLRLIQNYNRLLILYGAPTRGLYEIAKQENINLDEFTDFTLNFFHDQGTQTVRTEEAVIGSLAIINFLLMND